MNLLYATVIMRDGKPTATVNDGDSIIFFNFRPTALVRSQELFAQMNLMVLTEANARK